MARQETRKDVVIVGLGWTGSILGMELSQEGLDIVALERELAETLGTRVNVLNGRGNKGRLVINYSDLESLDGVLERLRGRRGD